MQWAYLFREHRRTHIGVAFLAQYLFHQFDIVGGIVYDQDLCVQDVLSAGHAYSRQIKAGAGKSLICIGSSATFYSLAKR
jgi:hypothetical protein